LLPLPWLLGLVVVRTGCAVVLTTPAGCATEENNYGLTLNTLTTNTTTNNTTTTNNNNINYNNNINNNNIRITSCIYLSFQICVRHSTLFFNCIKACVLD
jgi:hypothetical protein